MYHEGFMFLSAKVSELLNFHVTRIQQSRFWQVQESLLVWQWYKRVAGRKRSARNRNQQL